MMEIAMTAGQTATLKTSAKAASWTIASGTLDAGAFRLAADNGTALSGTVTIKSGAVMRSAQSGKTSQIISRTGTEKCSSFTIESGGRLICSGITPTIDADSVTLSGAVEYTKAGASAFLGQGSDASSAAISTYTDVVLNGSGSKTLAVNTTVNGTLTMAGDATGVSLMLGSFTLTYGGASTLNYSGVSAQTTSNNEFPPTGGLSLPNSVTVNNAGGVTLNGSKTVNGTLSLSSGTLTVGANTLTLNGPAIAGTPANLATTSSSSLVFGGSSPGVSVPSSVTALNNLDIYNSSGVTLGGDVAISGLAYVSNGRLNCGRYVVSGASFMLMGTSTLDIGSTAGITSSSSGNTGNIQTDYRQFSNRGTYIYTGGSGQVTGNGLPTSVGNLTIFNTPGVTLTRSVAVSGTALVLGTLYCGTALITGTGAFELQPATTLGIGSPDGLSSTPSTGNIQVTGTRTFDPGADYIYNGTAAQVTGNALPSTVRTLTINNNAGVALSSDLAVTSVLTLSASMTSGGFSVGAHTLTMNGPLLGDIALFFTTSASSLGFGGSSIEVRVPSTVTALNNLTINNANGVRLDTSLTLDGTLTLNVGSLDLNGHNLSTDMLAGDIPGEYALDNTSLTPSVVTVGVKGGSCNFMRSIGTSATSQLSLVKSGAGDLALSYAGRYAGTTTVSGGRLLVNCNLYSGGAITVQPGAQLGGTGTIDHNSGVITVSGTVAPGASVGGLTNGTEVWGPGGTYEWEMNDATGSAGSSPGWDFLKITGDLTINATNNNGDAGKFTIIVTNVGSATWPAHFSESSSYSWKIAEVTDINSSVVGFNASKFRVVCGLSPTPNGTFSVVLNGKAVEATYAPSGCGVTEATSYVDSTNPDNKLMVMTFKNTDGLASVQPLRMENCTITGKYYPNVNDDPSGGTAISPDPQLNVKSVLVSSPQKVILWAAKTGQQSQTAFVNAIVINTCGLGKSFDPVFTTLEIVSGNQVQQRFEGLLSPERYLHVLNGGPGLKWLEVNMNGRLFRLDPLTNGQEVSADLGSAMLEGENNVVILTGGGEVGASAVVTITDTPGGNMISLPEVVRLTLRQTGDGLVLAWPETLTGWALQASASPDGGWADFATAPAAVNGQLTVSVPMSDGARFYRLTGPAPTATSATVKGISLPANQPTEQPAQRTYDGILW
jgi:autotransporter-associated beta strand protein